QPWSPAVLCGVVQPGRTFGLDVVDRSVRVVVGDGRDVVETRAFDRAGPGQDVVLPGRSGIATRRRVVGTGLREAVGDESGVREPPHVAGIEEGVAEETEALSVR